MSKRERNDHKFPQANHQPRQKAADRIGRAQARIEFNSTLTLEQKIAKLPPEPFSKKERARLLAALEKRNAPKPIKEGLKDIEEGKTTPHEQVKQTLTKKYMKGNKNEAV
jgi:hypothetical protein